jgi:hypothetical protein
VRTWGYTKLGPRMASLGVCAISLCTFPNGSFRPQMSVQLGQLSDLTLKVLYLPGSGRQRRVTLSTDWVYT